MGLKRDIYDKLFIELHKDEDFPEKLIEKIKSIFESEDFTCESLSEILDGVLQNDCESQ